MAEAPTVCRRAVPPVALYVHIPFCVSICPYCDFVVYAGPGARGPRNRIASLLAAIEAEIGLRADEPTVASGRRTPQRQPLASLYFGGGTPSLVPADAIARLVDLVRRRFGLAAGAEVTLEANPGPDERGDPAACDAAGVNRISFGAQSLDADRAQAAGPASPARRRRRCGDARRARPGSRSINLDLLYDVPGGRWRSWMTTLEDALTLGPDHLSLYALTLDDPDAEGLTGPEWRPPADDVRRPALARTARAGPGRGSCDRSVPPRRPPPRRRRLARLRDLATGRGPATRAATTSAYWQRRPYEAVGPGAHAFDGMTPALECRPARRLPGRADPAAGAAPRCRRAARKRLMPARPRPSA